MSSTSSQQVRTRRPFVQKGLIKSRRWAEFVHQHSLQNGWESFALTPTIQMPASEEKNGVHIYHGSYQKTIDRGETISLRDAMALAVIYKTTRPMMYASWEATYENTLL